MNKNYIFQSMSEIELFELKNPDVLNTNPAANEAARRVFEAALTNERRKFLKVSQKIIKAMSINCVDENLTAILGIEDWLEKHPAITKTSEVDDAARERLEKTLAHAKTALATTLQAIPGSVVFNASNEYIIKIAKIEQRLGAQLTL